jgi:uncharacterized membrane protein
MDGVTTIMRGEGSRVAEAWQAVARDAAEWTALWATHAGPSVPAPPVEFGSQMVVAVFGGEQPTPGHQIEIVGVRRGASSLDVLVAERTPPGGRAVAQVMVTPFHFVSVPRSDADVRFVAADAASRPAGASPRPVHAPAARHQDISLDDSPSSTGLDRNFAAALAYLAGPFSGMTILLAEQRNRYVRFHAWQAILGLGGLGLLALLLLIGAFAGLVVSPAVFTTLYRTAFVALGVWVVLWAVLLVQAFMGRAWRLPLVGEAAARRAERT